MPMLDERARESSVQPLHRFALCAGRDYLLRAGVGPRSTDARLPR